MSSTIDAARLVTSSTSEASSVIMGDTDVVVSDKDENSSSTIPLSCDVRVGSDAESVVERIDDMTIEDIVWMTSSVERDSEAVEVEDEAEEDVEEDESEDREEELDAITGILAASLKLVFPFPMGKYLTHQNANQTPLSITLFFRIYATTSRNNPNDERINSRSNQSDFSRAVTSVLEVLRRVVNVLYMSEVVAIVWVDSSVEV